jgi:hypothetical protein
MNTITHRLNGGDAIANVVKPAIERQHLTGIVLLISRKKTAVYAG